MRKITLLLTIGMAIGSASDTTGRASAGTLPDCWWPGDLDGSTGVADLRDFAVLQRCLGLSDPAPRCGPDELLATDLQPDGFIDLRDYTAFAALAWPPDLTIDCGSVEPFGDIDRCGPGCLPDGDEVETGVAVTVTPREAQPLDGNGIRRIQVARDANTLTELVDPAPVGNVDFLSFEVIIFETLEAVENNCWGTVHCYNGTVDLFDGRRAAIVGYVQHGPLLCHIAPKIVTRAVVAPRSERPVVLLFIEWDGQVTQTITPLCE